MRVRNRRFRSIIATGIVLGYWFSALISAGTGKATHMQYRDLGKTGLKVSALSLGCMRFDPNNPELAEQIVDEAIAAGVNYFETTRGYIAGKCQHLTAPGLKGRSRGLIVSGKTGINTETTADSYRVEIDLQMQILGVDYLEFYQVGWFSLAQMEFCLLYTSPSPRD